MFSVEYLPLRTTNSDINFGPKALSTPNGNGIYLFHLHLIYELSCNSAECTWMTKQNDLMNYTRWDVITRPIIMYVGSDFSTVFCE